MRIGKILRSLPAGLLFLAASACGSQPAPAPSSAAAPRHAAWARLAANPGVAGEDYDPQSITVSYLPQATLPPGWAKAAPPAASAAASQPNPQLRVNRQFEPLTDAVAARYGLAVSQQVYWRDLNFAAFSLPAGADGAAVLRRLRTEGAGLVEAAVFTPLCHAAYEPNDPDFAAGAQGPLWDEWLMDCPRAWDVTRGDPQVVVAVLDTGARLTHEELQAQVIDPATAYPGTDCDLVNHDQDVSDTSGHGTFIAVIICAEADNNLALAGIAPLCRVLPLKISNGSAAASSDMVAAGVLADQLGARAVNCSWGSSVDDPNEQAMIDDLAADGVLFVAAAGNDSSYTLPYPAAYANACCVGATDETDGATAFTNWGPGIDIAAPGQDLKGCGIAGDSAYVSGASGTSFAAPMVAAGAALLWSYNPHLTLAQVRSALEQHGVPAHGFATGVRRLNLLQALGAVYVYPAQIAAVQPALPLTLGSQAAASQLDVAVSGAEHVDHIVYRLDLAPPGAGPEDLTATAATGDSFPASFGVAGLRNQTAELYADCYNSAGQASTWDAGAVYIFNQLGDIDGDGVVDAADVEALKALIGKHPGDPGFVGYADSDQDGTITEADAAAVGYNFGAHLP
jgi:hypothetical protein